MDDMPAMKSPTAEKPTLADRVSSLETNVASHEKQLGAILGTLENIAESLNRIGHEIGYH